jgi:hypothetical protein
MHCAQVQHLKSPRMHEGFAPCLQATRLGVTGRPPNLLRATVRQVPRHASWNAKHTASAGHVGDSRLSSTMASIDQGSRSVSLCMQGNESGLPPKVVGLGSLGLDYLATVSHFPEPDEKMRTEELQVRGSNGNGHSAA